MKKLLNALAAMMLLSLSSFSQTVTKNDTGIVRLKYPVALKAAIDLTKYDELVVRVDLMQKMIDNLERTNGNKDQTIKEKDNLINSMRLQIGNYQLLTNEYKKLEKSYKRSVRAGRFKIVLLVTAVVGGGYMIFNE